ncbi:hypothetical protein [Paludisphaera soli]|uniref:hypothetical protein n=1 Tax=Paludisphaera soli TaxID=2712865 RepID=UPI0013EC01E0|nr:hypothetical protein [Paludisphaera soli]
MNRTRTNDRDRRPNLENLETRDVPAVFNPLSAWAGILRGVPATVGDATVTPNTNTGPLTPNFPGGTTDPTTPGLPNPGNPLFPGRTTFLRSGPINVGGGTINTGGGVITTPPVSVPGTSFNFNSSFLRTGNPGLGITTPGVAVPSVDIGVSPGDITTPGITSPGSL